MDFAGSAKPLSDGDVRLIAGYLGCHVAAVRGVLAVESAGKGFDSKRRPKMLFEPHIFWKQLGTGAKRDKAAKEGLAYPKWKPGSYPKDSYPRLESAMAIDEPAALKSCSWGLGQVMGFNHGACGFDTVEDMVEAMLRSEGAQLFAMARFIVSKGLQGHLAKLNWSSFAKGYNGSSYARHGYHTKLAKAYAKRPASEKMTPIPTTTNELDRAFGPNPKAVALPDRVVVEPKPRPLDPEPVPPPPVKPVALKKRGFIAFLINLIIALFKRER